MTKRKSKAESSPFALHFRQVRPRQHLLLIDPLESVKADLLAHVHQVFSILATTAASKEGYFSLRNRGRTRPLKRPITLLQRICCPSTLSTLRSPSWIVIAQPSCLTKPLLDESRLSTEMQPDSRVNDF